MSPSLSRAVAALALAAAPASGPALPLPKPAGQVPAAVIGATFPDRPERLRRSILPGPVDDTERVDVLVAGSGAPAAVALTQHLVLSGTGQFIVWERSSAQDAVALEDTVAPVLKREAVIWQGFVSGTKTLAARLTLDAGVEAGLLPFAVTVTPPLGPGGAVGPGDVTVRIANTSGRAMTLPTGVVSPAALAGPLDALLTYARSRSAAAPPVAGRGLPLTLAATSVGATRQATTVAPLRVTGTIRAAGAAPVTPESAAVRPLADGLRLDGVLAGAGEFTVHLPAATTLALDLTVTPTLDARLLEPPRGHTWADWLRLGPTPQEAATALTLLVEGAAAAARDDEYAPYLGHHGPGAVHTTFHVRVAPREVIVKAVKPLRPKAFPIALASIALLAIAGNAAAIHRRL